MAEVQSRDRQGRQPGVLEEFERLVRGWVYVRVGNGGFSGQDVARGQA